MPEVAKTAPKTVRKMMIGKTEFRLVQNEGRFFGMENGTIAVEGDEAEETWRLLLDGNAAPERRYFGMDGARKLFLHHYPNGFHSSAFAERGERGYKIAAKSKLEQTAPLEKAMSETGLAEAVLSVFNATDLKSPFGKMRIKDALRSRQADDFIRAAARFASGEDRKGALRDMEKALKPHGAAKWTSVTYLPFLWRPEAHMFLKPESTLDFAERTGHRFASVYSPPLDLRIYDSLLDLAASTKEKIADLDPRDNIDVQSFIWVVSGAYKNEPPRP